LITREIIQVKFAFCAKSLGNFYTLRDLLDQGYTGSEIRYLLLQTHYRTQLNFTFEGLSAARHSLERFKDFIFRLKSIKEGDSLTCASLIEKTHLDFKRALSDDLNISAALASLFDLIREANTLYDQEKLTKVDAENILSFFQEVDTVLGVLPLEEETFEIPPDVQKAFEKREAARAAKDYDEADLMRTTIHSKGLIVEDTPSGPRLKKQ